MFGSQKYLAVRFSKNSIIISLSNLLWLRVQNLKQPDIVSFICGEELFRGGKKDTIYDNKILLHIVQKYKKQNIFLVPNSKMKQSQFKPTKF